MMIVFWTVRHENSLGALEAVGLLATSGGAGEGCLRTHAGLFILAMFNLIKQTYNHNSNEPSIIIAVTESPPPA